MDVVRRAAYGERIGATITSDAAQVAPQFSGSLICSRRFFVLKTQCNRTLL